MDFWVKDMIEEKASTIKILFLDVDGVMTDGSVTLDARGEEIKTFDVKDGQGLKMLMAGGRARKGWEVSGSRARP